jgi:hypothetical protein
MSEEDAMWGEGVESVSPVVVEIITCDEGRQIAALHIKYQNVEEHIMAGRF